MNAFKSFAWCAVAWCLLVPANLAAQVPYLRIAQAEREPQHWLTYSGGYKSHRFTTLDQITTKNVARLRTAWIYQVKRTGMVEASPIVVDGVMYITEPPSTVTALDVRTGRPLWSWTPAMPGVKFIGFPPVNRGVAILDDTVYVGTLNAHLVALDAKTGAVRWDAVVADNKTGHSITCAPLALDGKIIIGISGGEAGIRGFLDAYDPKNGKRLWRSWTIPGPGEPGNETWGGDNSWKTGAGPTWVTGSYDPDLNLLYWGTGNPGPDWNGDVRPGDNLYTCCVLALDPATGKRKWHFQFTPHDVHDWDCCQIPVLVDGVYQGKQRKLLVTANRNAFYYVLDRESGEFLHGVPYAKQTWAKGLDKEGHPIRLPDTFPSEKGTLVWPSLQGATNWFSPSYSPETKLFYVAVREMGAYYFKGEAKYEPGKAFLGGGEQALGGDKAWGAVRALDVMTGKMVWEFKLLSPPWAGLLSTAGGLVFGGSNEGHFYALDARTGKSLWHFQTGGPIRANPVSFALDGQQYIAIAAGNAILVFGLPPE
jgi:alcohol dehydrogenase (cytochrome c)